MGSIRATSAALVVLVALGASACGADADSSDASGDAAAVDARAGEPADADAGGRGTDDAAAPQEEATTAGSSAPAAPLGLDVIGRAIAVEAGVTIGSSDIRRAVDDTLAVVRREGATVFNADVNIGDTREDGSVDGTARLVVKVAPDQLDPLIAALDGVSGTLLGRTQTSDDVTDQLVDLDIRIRVERQTIEQFEMLLGQATEFQDVVDIQRVITERTIALEQLLASQRNTNERVELSTLTVDLVYRSPAAEAAVVASDGDDGIADAFRRGWDALVGALFIIGFVLAVAAPFAAIGAALVLVVWAVGRRQRRRRSTPASFGPPSPTAAGEDEIAHRSVGEDERRPHAGVGDHLG